MQPKTLKNKAEITEFLQRNDAALLYFYNNNCAPCISLRPKVIELVEKRFPKMKLVYVDSLQSPEVSAFFQVFSNPTLLVFFEGKEYNRLSKYVSIPQLEESIGRPYQLLFE